MCFLNVTFNFLSRLLIKILQKQIYMFKNFLQITFRNFLKNKVFVIVNVLGLGIALACCIVAYYNAKFDKDFDSFHSNKNIIHKITITRDYNGRDQAFGISPFALGPAIGNSISGIEAVNRFYSTGMPVRYEDNIFNRQIAFVDNNYFDLFDFPMLAGDKNAFQDKSSVLISNQFSRVLFGADNPIGKIIKIYIGGTDKIFNVAAVFDDIPENSTMQFQVLVSMENYIDLLEIKEHSWNGWVAATFLKIPDESNIPAINKELEKFVPIQNEARDDWKISNFYTERMADIPHTGRNTWNYWLRQGMHPAAIIAPSIMAILILLLACLNFMNTSLAISSRRLKDIGIRKVLGGIKSQSIIQFLGENIVLCIIALGFAISISGFLLDAYSKMWPGLTLLMDFSNNVEFWFFLIGLLILTGILSGAYPAFYISGFNPVKILKGAVKYKGGGLLSKILLTLQFILASTGIVCAVIFAQNAFYQENLYMGFDKDQVIAVPINNNSELEAMKAIAMQNPNIDNIGVSEEHIGLGTFTINLKSGEEEHEIRGYDIGQGYFETMKIRLKEGRHFDIDFKESERGKAIIVNEKFVEDFKWESAIGQRLRLNDTTEYTVIGVMEDFYPQGFWDKMNPTIFRLGAKERMRMLVVNATIDQLDGVNAFLKEEWEKLVPNATYQGFFQKETLSEAKDINKNILNIFLFLGLVSIVLSLVGLYTLVSLNIIKRTKEIGIRKVLGISMFRLIRILNKEFVFIVLISSIVGSLFGYFLSDMLMGSIWAYYKDFSISSIIIPVVLIVLVSILSLSAKVYKAANKNPVDAIKYE